MMFGTVGLGFAGVEDVGLVEGRLRAGTPQVGASKHVGHLIWNQNNRIRHLESSRTRGAANMDPKKQDPSF